MFQSVFTQLVPVTTVKKDSTLSLCNGIKKNSKWGFMVYLILSAGLLSLISQLLSWPLHSPVHLGEKVRNDVENDCFGQHRGEEEPRRDGGLRLMWREAALGRKERHPRNLRASKNKTAPEMLVRLRI